MDNLTILERHPLSAAFGTMGEADRAELKASIKTDDGSVEITLYEGKALDGWHRYRCMLALYRDPTPRMREFAGDDPAAFVLRVNDWRRHVSKLERCKTRIQVYRWRAEREGEAAPSARAIAEEMGVSLPTALDAMNELDGKPPRPERTRGGRKRAKAAAPSASDKALIAELSGKLARKEEELRTLRRRIEELLVCPRCLAPIPLAVKRDVMKCGKKDTLAARGCHTM